MANQLEGTGTKAQRNIRKYVSKDDAVENQPDATRQVFRAVQTYSSNLFASSFRSTKRTWTLEASSRVGCVNPARAKKTN